jgi:AbrB family looped-hinge helix DNA binding protein
MILTISKQGWVVIPAELRKKYHLTPGTKVVIVDYGVVLAIVPAMKDPVKQGHGMLKVVLVDSGTAQRARRGPQTRRSQALITLWLIQWKCLPQFVNTLIRKAREKCNAMCAYEPEDDWVM